MNIDAILRKVPFFTQLNEAQIKKLASLGKTVEFTANSFIFHEGESAECMYILANGSVRIFRIAENNIESEIAVVQDGDFFGEMALLDGQSRSASAIALTDCELFTLDQFAFMSLILQSRSQVVFRVFSALIARIRDSDQRNLEKELEIRSLADKMEIERLRSLSQMVAGVAHELNTPLGIINTAASIIQNTLTSDELKSVAQEGKTKAALENAHEALDLMQRNVQRAHKLTQDFKKISVSQLTDTKEKMHLLEAINEVLNLFSINARKAKIETRIITDLTGDDDLWLGYQGYLSQVLLNLLTNIERYAYPDSGGGIVEITVTKDAVSPSHFTISVRDFGKGIPPENVLRVFEPFFTTGRIKGGTGLGLAIVHNIVTSALKGTITVTSQIGAGTTFQIAFPKEIQN